MQEAYIIGQSDAFGLGNQACTAYFAIEVGDLEISRIEEAWNSLVRRHSALRIVFSVEHGQRVLEEVPTVHFVDLGSASTDDVKTFFDSKVQDPRSWPLFQCAVSRSESGVVLHIEFNALVADGRSVQILLAEFQQLCVVGHSNLPRLGYSFQDYCLRLSRQRARETNRSHVYWADRLRQVPANAGLSLVADPATMRGQGYTRRTAKLNRDQWRALNEEAAAHGLSVNAVFLASYILALASHSRYKTFPVGVTVFNRPEWHSDINKVVGDFTGLLPFIVDGLDTTVSFAEHAALIQRLLWEDLSHFGPTTTGHLRAILRSQRGAAGALPIVFTSHIGTDFELGEWRIVGSQTETPQVWIDHQLVEVNGSLLFFWEVAVGLFDDELVERLFDSHSDRIVRLAASEGWSDACLPSHAFSAPEKPARLGILPIWPRKSVALTPAIVASDRTLSHAEVATEVSRLATALEQRTAPGDRVAIAIPKGWRQVVAALAVTQAGRVYVPIATDLPASRVKELKETCAIDLVLTDPGHQWPAIGIFQAHLDVDEPFDSCASARPIASPAEKDVAYIIFTSGSTGRPKGVAIEHGAAHNTIFDINHRFAVSKTDRVLGLSSLSFDLSVYDIFGLIAAGGAIVIPEERSLRDPEAWARQCATAGVTIWNSVPALAEMFVEYLESRANEVPSTLRLFLLSGDWIPISLPDRIRSLWPESQVISLGGATEAAIWSVCYPIDNVEPEWSSIPYGRAMDGQTVDVFDEQLHVLPDDVVGEICIGGAGLAREYWKEPNQTADRFRMHASGERLYLTGDLGRRRPDGVIELLGREDGQVKINGFRIELGEIEACLLACPGVTRCCAAVYGKRLAAFVTVDPASRTAEEDQIAWLRERLPPYLLPSRIIQLESMPLSWNGKVERNALKIPDEDECSDEPSDDLEQMICGLVANITGVTHCRLDQDFFQIGGTSIQLIRLHRVLVQRCKIDCPLRDFAAHTRLRDMVALARRCPTGALSRDPVLEKGTDLSEPFEMLPVQQAYWIGRRSDLDLGGVAPHVYVEFESGDLDIGRAEGAWNQLVSRHPALRTVFGEDARQHVLSDVPASAFEIIDLRGMRDEAVSIRRETVRARMSHQVFNPAIWPLFSHAVTVGDNGTIWHVSLDLLIGDAWSMAILATEFSELYRDPGKQLQPLELTFKDWAISRKSWVESTASEGARDYWTRQIKTLPMAPRLELDRKEIHPRFARLRHIIEKCRWTPLQAAAAEVGVTSVNLLLGLFCETLHAHGAGDEFVLNITFFNRDNLHPDMARIVGDFTSLLLLPVLWNPHLNFIENVQRLQLGLFDVMQHASMSTVDIIRLAAPDTSIVAPVVFTSTLGVVQDAAPDFAEFPFREVYSISQTPQVWLDSQLSESAGNLVVTWDYRFDLLDEAAVRDLFDSFIVAAERIAAGERNLGEVNQSVLSEPTKHQPSKYMRLYRDRPALRRELGESISLERSFEGAKIIRRRTSCREFIPGALTLKALARVLFSLSDVADPERFVPKRSYASAGSLYPVQIYVSVQTDITGLGTGTYYYNPDCHSLSRTGHAVDFGTAADIAADAVITLVASMDAIEPVYGEKSRDFALIEAGLIAHTIETWAAARGLGACQVGWSPPEDWRDAAAAGLQMEYLHAILVGVPVDRRESVAGLCTDGEPAPGTPEEESVTGELMAVLTQALREAAGLKALDSKTNLFRAGGDSVAAVRANTLASESIGAELPLRLLLENPSANEWARALRAGGIVN
jgi:nonribosomal peptide synthetase protein BlmIV